MVKVKSIEDMARDYQRSDYADGTSATAFEHGAEWMRMVLTSWHDPKKELPDENADVIVRYVARKEGICTGRYNINKERWELNDMYLCHLSTKVPIHIIAWREIHELQ